MSNIAKERYTEMLEMPSEKAYGVAVENEMIRRVRLALFDALCEHLYDADGVAMQGGRFFISGADSHIDGAILARAAVAAMREPTEEMVDCCYAQGIDWGPGGSGDNPATAWNVWAALIDAALTQPKEG